MTSTPGLSIRPFQGPDLPALQSIRQAAFAPVFRSFRALVGEPIAELAFAGDDAEQGALLAQICAKDPEQVLVAELGDKIVGFSTYTLNVEKKIGELGLNAIAPEYAGRGFGTLLYERTLAEMKARGMLVATVGTGGDPSHAAARRAYEKVGFGPSIPSLYFYKLL